MTIEVIIIPDHFSQKEVLSFVKSLPYKDIEFFDNIETHGDDNLPKHQVQISHNKDSVIIRFQKYIKNFTILECHEDVIRSHFGVKLFNFISVSYHQENFNTKFNLFSDAKRRISKRFNGICFEEFYEQNRDLFKQSR